MDPGPVRVLSIVTLLVDLLAGRCRPCSVSELAECIDVGLSVVSRHLALPRAVGVLRATKTGRTVLYEIQYDAVAEALRGIADTLDRAREDFAALASCRAPTGNDKEKPQ
ncbi:helix-turn-helix transcriptional regulator [Streptomyces verrucosisporus]|uniref:ArsR/SmtB family transcription factor n=1 Tax=Streptomyces verrucosisporus TaxID=1695161 RepID=UPI0019D00891|nr:helix-turn-helix domain-containing protein [Streptomyces verrucosisporus]MBN3933148.1 helix-turn-helix transcriptional regulator [Streptomyces verrucosisporus]